MPGISETERVQQQTNDEWLAEHQGIDYEIHTETSQVLNMQSDASINKQSVFYDSVKNAGITSIRYVGEKLLINADGYITADLDSRIKKNILHLAKYAAPDTGESLYVYTGYRTFIKKGVHLAVTFNEIYTGEIGERYFETILKNKKGEFFTTGENREFRITGNKKRIQKGMFLKFWLDAVKQIPNDRPSQIHRYMNSKLSGVVVSCTDSVPHYEFTKLKTLRYEGRLYMIT